MVTWTSSPRPSPPSVVWALLRRLDPGLLAQAWVRTRHLRWLVAGPRPADAGLGGGLATFGRSWLGPSPSARVRALACFACSQVMVVGPRTSSSVGRLAAFGGSWMTGHGRRTSDFVLGLEAGFAGLADWWVGALYHEIL